MSRYVVKTLMRDCRVDDILPDGSRVVSNLGPGLDPEANYVIRVIGVDGAERSKGFDGWEVAEVSRRRPDRVETIGGIPYEVVDNSYDLETMVMDLRTGEWEKVPRDIFDEEGR